MSTTYLHILLPKDQKCHCDNCGWTGKAKKLKPLSSIEERIYPGEEVPAGECPKCTACAFIIPKKSKAQKMLIKWDRLRDAPGIEQEQSQLLDELHKEIVGK